MARLTAHPPDTRKAIEALLREGRLRPTAIAARTGVPRSTIATWLAQLAPPGTPPPRKTVRRPRKPSRLTLRQRTALARLLPLPGLDPKDLAQAIGLARDTAIRTFAAAGLRRPHATRAASQPPTPVALDAALRAHAARQIAAFDARLTGGDSEIDSARVLRDLSGLRRLIDDIGRRQPPPEGDADVGSAQDLVACRARLVRHLASVAPADLAERLSRGPDTARSDQPGA